MMKTIPKIIEAARNLRKGQTQAERVLWEILRGSQFKNFKFRRQHPIGRFIADFFCYDAKLVIELDGSAHNSEEQKEYDLLRSNFINQQGFKVLRFKNNDVIFNTGKVLREIKNNLTPDPSPYRRGALSGAKRGEVGFSLIELVVYIAIAAGVLTASVNSISTLMKSFNNARITSKINNSAEAAMERMTREIRNAYSINASSVLGSSPGRLKLNTYNAVGATTTIEFYLDNEVLNVAEGVGAGNPLSLNGVAVSNLVFRQIENSTSSKAIKVEVTINSKNFYDTAILRNSY